MGVVAAQSIGEPGTQLTMRTFIVEELLDKMILPKVCHELKKFLKLVLQKKAISDVAGRIKIEFAQKTITDKDGKNFS